MSAVSSVAGSTTDLFQILQQQAQQADSTSANAAGSSDPTTDSTQASSATGSHHGHHHHGGGGGGGISKIESAVTSALQASDGTEDPNQIIKDAIAKALQSPVATSANSTTPANATSSDPTTSNASFNQLLQSYGVDPQQFGQDLQSAVSGTQGSSGASGTTVDFAALFKSFPPGSAIETTG